MTKLRVFFKKFFSHLFGLGGGVLVGVFEKSPDILLLCWNLYIAPSLTPCLRAILWTPLKKISSPNPRLEAVLSTYHRKFRLNLLQQLLRLKNDTIFIIFSHNLIPQLWRRKSEALFQKSFPIPISQVFRANLNPFFGIVALLLIPGHLRAKTEHQSWKT